MLELTEQAKQYLLETIMQNPTQEKYVLLNLEQNQIIGGDGWGAQTSLDALLENLDPQKEQAAVAIIPEYERIQATRETLERIPVKAYGYLHECQLTMFWTENKQTAGQIILPAEETARLLPITTESEEELPLPGILANASVAPTLSQELAAAEPAPSLFPSGEEEFAATEVGAPAFDVAAMAATPEFGWPATPDAFGPLEPAAPPAMPPAQPKDTATRLTPEELQASRAKEIQDTIPYEQIATKLGSALNEKTDALAQAIVEKAGPTIAKYIIDNLDVPKLKKAIIDGLLHEDLTELIKRTEALRAENIGKQISAKVLQYLKQDLETLGKAYKPDKAEISKKTKIHLAGYPAAIIAGAALAFTGAYFYGDQLSPKSEDANISEELAQRIEQAIAGIEETDTAALITELTSISQRAENIEQRIEAIATDVQQSTETLSGRIGAQQTEIERMNTEYDDRTRSLQTEISRITSADYGGRLQAMDETQSERIRRLRTDIETELETIRNNTGSTTTPPDLTALEQRMQELERTLQQTDYRVNIDIRYTADTTNAEWVAGYLQAYQQYMGRPLTDGEKAYQLSTIANYDGSIRRDSRQFQAEIRRLGSGANPVEVRRIATTAREWRFTPQYTIRAGVMPHLERQHEELYHEPIDLQFKPAWLYRLIERLDRNNDNTITVPEAQ